MIQYTYSKIGWTVAFGFNIGIVNSNNTSNNSDSNNTNNNTQANNHYG